MQDDVDGAVLLAPDAAPWPVSSAPPGKGPGRVSTMRYVARYSWLWLCLVGILCTDVAVMLTRGAPWRGDLVWTIDWLPIALVLVGPLVAGFVAMDTARLAVGVRGLALARGRSDDVPVALTYAVALTALHLVVVAGALVVSRPAVMDWGAPVAVLVHLLIVLFFVALGSLVGRFAPVVIGGVSAALAALTAVYLFTAPQSSVGLLYGGAATTPRIGYSYDVPWLTAQAFALVVVIGASWTVRPARSSRVRTLLVAGLALVVALAAGAALSVVPGQRLTANRAAPDACGALAGVPWCYHPQHERVVGLYADRLLALFEAAETQGYEGLVPERVLEADQQTWPSDATTGAFYVTPEALAGRAPTLWDVTTRLVEPVHCTALAGERPPRDAYWEDLAALTATWAGLVDTSAAEGQFGYDGEPLSPTEAEQIMTEFRTCTYAFS